MVLKHSITILPVLWLWSTLSFHFPVLLYIENFLSSLQYAFLFLFPSKFNSLQLLFLAKYCSLEYSPLGIFWQIWLLQKAFPFKNAHLFFFFLNRLAIFLLRNFFKRKKLLTENNFFFLTEDKFYWVFTWWWIGKKAGQIKICLLCFPTWE